jgi:hypothetical protein
VPLFAASPTFQAPCRDCRESDLPDDELRTDLVQAIASELIGLGYRVTAKRCDIQQTDKPIRVVADETWCSMNEIGGQRRA